MTDEPLSGLSSFPRTRESMVATAMILEMDNPRARSMTDIGSLNPVSERQLPQPPSRAIAQDRFSVRSKRVVVIVQNQTRQQLQRGATAL